MAPICCDCCATLQETPNEDEAGDSHVTDRAEVPDADDVSERSGAGTEDDDEVTEEGKDIDVGGPPSSPE